MHKIGTLLVILGGLTLLAACDIIGRNDETSCETEGILFQDDFEDAQACGWVLYNRRGSIAEIEGGVLRISTSQRNLIWWTNPGRNFDDVVMTVQARQASGPNDNAYGVICRYQDEQNFYIFLISGDGYYAIGKYESGVNQVVYLTGNGQYAFSDMINQGVATNQIRVSCVGNDLSLSVNGVPLATVTDSTFLNGDIGMGVSTFELGTAVIEFDNLVIVGAE